ncbi:NTP transferase domain-containing protein [Clostridium tagluense]|uniref:sugar phosphate nucleotidyltransferase n=1 Tax=Clostridium tagluense TaxID=360422 RepID=UPI001CF54C7B|nr:sugar phosphate nucleotidyltransferase [Clostridium tagluense]MCB2312390.1 NTP transferase domain-containing protein [Clostridium tagluense]MCB2317065.1 NTP transferase domain-containing protein [Clostridium tagluense]MCB2321908.1 NTP transferase domain-containing protein [Clostridium tagluense]MCB2326823.1 NTP transferase domain-containing protein [Clostridium tagluense]MCB2331635.1 NTP transferase domain-containing protein [Clostridium tagluense]
MKGIILAGGTGSRLYPLIKATNKHLLPVGKYPMIYYLIAKMKQADITDIMIISGKEHMGAIVNLLGSGYEYGVKYTFRIQDQPGGIAEALGLCEEFVGKDSCIVLLGDNIFEDDIYKYVKNFEKKGKGAELLLKKVADPERYGIAEIENGRIISIEEKPKNPKGNYCVTGIYMYDNRVFEVIKELKPSNRGELEITDVNNWYIKDGSLTYDIMKGWWTDAGTFSSLMNANILAKDIDLDYILSRDFKVEDR